MKAMVWTAYGPPEVLQLKEVEKPVPKDNEILVRVRAATVTAGDSEMRSMKGLSMIGLVMRVLIGIRRPQRITILGQEFAGEVEATGKNVGRFKTGDRVFGVTGFRFGVYAEYACFPEGGALAQIPANLSYEEAAGVPVGGLEALHYLRLANLRPGQKVLINGAGGSIGTFAVQLAKNFGAVVTAVDSGEKLEMLRSIGADRVIDYTREDFTSNSETYDVIFDVPGKSHFSRSLKSLNDNGYYLIGNPGRFMGMRKRLTPGIGSRKVFYTTGSQRTEDLLYLKDLIEAGKVKPVVDRCFPLEETVEAHRYVETGRKQGNVIIKV